jgi:hypothetical protein
MTKIWFMILFLAAGEGSDNHMASEHFNRLKLNYPTYEECVQDISRAVSTVKRSIDPVTRYLGLDDAKPRGVNIAAICVEGFKVKIPND